MTEGPRKFAFVSGKGGVGKTVLAASFALLSSTKHRTALIDLDFQNQGASGLLASYVNPGCINAFELLLTRSIDIKRLIQVREQLFFIPAFDPSKTDRFGSQPASSSFQSASVDSFARILNDLIAVGNFDAVIVDCHGGLDDNSFAAFIYSDTTFIVTEADKVTFNGTLELMDFYVERAAAISSARAKNFTASEIHREETITQRVAHVEENKIRFLINRVSDKFGYNALKDILTRQFDANVQFFHEMNQGFSEYPFFIELLPESIFSQKMELLYRQVTGAAPIVQGRSRFYRLFERVSPVKLDESLRSPYDIRVRAVFSFVAVVQVLIILLFLLLVIALPTKLFDRMSDSEGKVLGSLALIGLSVFLLYLTRFNLLVGGFFRDRLRYEWRLYSRGVRQMSIAFTLRIFRAFLFRSTLVVWACLYFALSVAYLVLAVVVWRGD